MTIKLPDANTHLINPKIVRDNNDPPRMRIGTDEFHDLVVNSDVFVDKSLMIKELLDDSGKVILITRPRRWGKTLNMDMIRRFLEIEVDERGKPLPLEQRSNIKLFTGGEIDLGFVTGRKKLLNKLKIADYPNIIAEYQGQFPVIFITFKSVEGEEYQHIEQGMKTQLRMLFQAHRYLINSDQLAQDEKDEFAVYLSQEITIDNIKNSLSILTKLLYKHYNRKVWVLIDEYDTPINSAYKYFGTNEREFQKVLELFRGIMKSTFKKETGKSELPVERGVITGILRIAKAELFSGLNNVREYTLLDKKFAKSYGFTQVEVDELLTKVPTKTNPEEIKNWYNGYTFGGEIIYNPWSIMQCLDSEGVLDHYWLDSGGTGLIDKVLLSDEIQQDLQELLIGNGIIKKLYKQISLQEIEEDEDIFYSLLVFAGYLNPCLADDNPEAPTYSLSIPNKEVRHIYIARVTKWVARKLNIRMSEYDNFINLLLLQRIDKFKEKLQQYLLNSTSYHDLIGERDYHNLMGGILAPLTRKYTIESNRESGHGRSDHILTPIFGRGDHAIIIEYKLAETAEDLESAVSTGLDQIMKKQYDTKVREHPHVKKITKISMAFYGKAVAMQYQIDTIAT